MEWPVWPVNSSSSVLGLVVFFFQAEDGIRDLTVTGVQTCALPISQRKQDFHNALLGVTAFLKVDDVQSAVSALFRIRGRMDRLAGGEPSDDWIVEEIGRAHV